MFLCRLMGPLVVWDTHLKGVTVPDSAGKQKPDGILSDRFKTLVNAVVTCERKPSLDSTSYLDDAAYQIKQRMESFQPFQPSRVVWISIAFDSSNVDIWRYDQVYRPSTFCKLSLLSIVKQCQLCKTETSDSSQQDCMFQLGFGCTRCMQQLKDDSDALPVDVNPDTDIETTAILATQILG